MIKLTRRAFATSILAAAAPALGQTDPLARRFGGPFTLTAHDGRRISNVDFRGRLMLVYFGFTHCGDTCPGDLLTIAHALDALGERQTRIQPLFITVDPKNDTPQVMADYVANFHPRLIGLTGSDAEIAAVVKAYRVHRLLLDIKPRADAADMIQRVHGPGGRGEYRGGGQTIDHGSLTYLMGPDGGFLTLFPTNTDARKMSSTLSVYLARLAA